MNPKTIVLDLKKATPKELGVVLDKINEQVFADNEWNSYSVKAEYHRVINEIDTTLDLLRGMQICGTFDMRMGNDVVPVSKVISNLKIAKGFFTDPPILTKTDSDVHLDSSVNTEMADVSTKANTTADVNTLEDKTAHIQQSQSENVHDGYAFGYKGIMEAFGWGRTKIAKVLKDEKYAAAIEQEGKKIAVNIEKMHELLRLSNKKKGAPRRR